MSSRGKGEALDRERRAMMAVAKELKALEGLTLTQLREKHVALFGAESRTKNKAFLKKKLAWRIQELAEGGLTAPTMASIKVLAPKEIPTRAERKIRPKKVVPAAPVVTRDPRLPEAGTLLQRIHDGATHEVEVLESGFRYRGKLHKSLSAIASLITGTAWNGFLFFGLTKRGEKA